MTQPSALQEPALFGATPLNAASLSIAQENFTAARPPIRERNVTREIMSMLRNQPARQSLAKQFAEVPTTPILKSFSVKDLCQIDRT